MVLPKNAEIIEVCPRDGWQNHCTLIPTETKIRYIKEMIDCGVRNMEICSFVNPKLVPQMADSAEVFAGVKDYAAQHNCKLSGIALNKRGVEQAREAGLHNLSFVLSVSEEHNQRNSHKTIQESLDAFLALAHHAEGMNISLALPCVFGSPFGDDISMSRVVSIIEAAFAAGVSEIGLADTAGISTPANIKKVLRCLSGFLDITTVRLHLHDTRGMGLANAYAALEEGVMTFDASMGALGGCPFVPGAKGNIGTEDLVHMFEKMGVQTTYDLTKTLALVKDMSDTIQAIPASSMAKLSAGHE